MAIYFVHQGRLYLRCHYHDRERVKQIPGARWHPERKLWYWPLVNRGDERRIVAALQEAFNGNLEYSSQSLINDGLDDLPACGDPLAQRLMPLLDELRYPSRRKPYPHQREAVAALQVRPRFLLLWEMGLGKTQAAIEAACYALQHQHVSRVYIICPATVRESWRQEILACAWIAPDDISVVRPNPPRTDPEHQPCMSDPEYRRHQLERLATWTILNYEAAVAEQKLLTLCSLGQFLIVDEAHLLRNPQTKRARTVLALQPHYAILQTGTPVINNPGDIWTSAHFVAPGLLGTSWADFRDRFVVTRPIRWRVRKQNGSLAEIVIEKDVGYRHLDEIRRRLESISLRHTKAECLASLPPKITHRLLLEPSLKQMQIYARECGLVVAELQEQIAEAGSLEAVPLPQFVSQFVRLQQIADGFWPDPVHESVLHRIDDAPKWEAADEIIEEATSCGRKVVIWVRFVALARYLAERYKGYGAAYLAGEIAPYDRDRIVRAFQNDPRRQVLIATLHVGGLGLNLQIADCEIFWSRWWAPAVNAQAEDRCHRVGQKHPVDIHHLVLKNTIDEQVEAILRRKQQWAAQVTGDTTERFSAEERRELLRAAQQYALDYEQHKKEAERK